MEDNDWSIWCKHVLMELERLNDCHAITNARFDALLKEVADYKLTSATDITALKVKAGIWGLAAGAIPVTIAIMLKIF